MGNHAHGCRFVKMLGIDCGAVDIASGFTFLMSVICGKTLGLRAQAKAHDANRMLIIAWGLPKPCNSGKIIISSISVGTLY